MSRDDRDASSSIAERALLRRDPRERQHVIEDSKRQMAGVDGKKVPKTVCLPVSAVG